MYAIPTRYNGIQFRSRLEARWAAMFDLLQWPYEYEPCDFAGWIPDFLLKIHTPVFVEVKPVASFPPEVADEIDTSGCFEECLIVGTTIEFPYFGWLREIRVGDENLYYRQKRISHERIHLGWARACFGLWSGTESQFNDFSNLSNPEQKVGFCHEIQSYADRVTGCYDGGSWGMRNCRELVENKWKTAGNTVQWRKPSVSL